MACLAQLSVLLRWAELPGLVLVAEHVVVAVGMSSWKVMLTGEPLNGFALEGTDFLTVSHRFEEFQLLEREKITELSPV